MAHERGVPEESIRRAISALPDVQSSKVEYDQDGGIIAIHVVSSGGRLPKQIVRDIESVLQAQVGIKIDHRKISVAKVAEKAEPKPAKFQRARLLSMNLGITGHTGRCKVILERDGFEAVGEASGVTAGGGTLRLIAAATFRAVERLVSRDIAFELLDVERLCAGRRNAILVLATYVSANDIRNLAGCVQYDNDEQRAVVHAALDACNRIVEILPRAEQTEYEITPFEDA